LQLGFISLGKISEFLRKARLQSVLLGLLIN
jgi:hypothetical protein